MPEGKKPKPVRRRVTITISCLDDAAEQADVNMKLHLCPPVKKDENSLVLETAVAMMRGAKADSEDWRLKG